MRYHDKNHSHSCSILNYLAICTILLWWLNCSKCIMKNWQAQLEVFHTE